MIRVPDSVFENALPLQENCIVEKFVSKAPHVGLIHMKINKIWSLGDKSIKVEVFVVDDTTVKFKIPNARIRDRVLSRGMWSIKNIPMIVSKQSPIVEEAQLEVKSIPMWVVVRNVVRKERISTCPALEGSKKRDKERSIDTMPPAETWEVVKSPAKSHERGINEVGGEILISNSRFASLLIEQEDVSKNVDTKEMEKEKECTGELDAEDNSQKNRRKEV